MEASPAEASRAGVHARAPAAETHSLGFPANDTPREPPVGMVKLNPPAPVSVPAPAGNMYDGYYGEKSKPASTRGSQSSIEGLVDGKSLYLAACVDCHGADGRGRSMPEGATQGVDLSRVEWAERMSEASFLALLRDGRGSMKGLGASLTGAQSRALWLYTRGLAGLRDERP